MATSRTVDKDCGDCTAFDALDRLIDPAGLDLVDIGAGAGDLACGLVRRGGRVTAVEPDLVQARKNDAAPSSPSLTFTEASAEALPLTAASADGVVFSKSLHHVPIGAMPDALSEAVRVLRDDGFLYVLEPDIEGDYAALARPFHDETIPRRVTVFASR